MNIDNQIRYWAQLVSESLDESDDALIGGSQIDSKIKELENIANQIKPKLQNALKTQRDKIPQDKLKTLIIKLIQIDPDSVSEEDYKVVGLVKSEYMDMIKDVGDSLEDITKESMNNISESNTDNGASEFLKNIVKEFVNNKLDTKDWKNLDDTLFEKMTQYTEENNLKINEFAYNLDVAWMKIYKTGEQMKFSQEEKNMFMALGDSTRQMIIRSKKQP